MKVKVGFVDYGVGGNLYSIKKSIEHVGGEAIRLQDASDFSQVDKIVLPGVGSFHKAATQLRQNGLFDILRAEIKQKDTLGICLGMQLFARAGFEDGETEGLGLIEAEVKPVLCSDKVPHMGFSTINVRQSDPVLAGVEEQEFYFMHSYEVVNYTNVIALSNYSGHEFVSAVRKDRLVGVQFHPEKSREAGLQVFRNFLLL